MFYCLKLFNVAYLYFINSQVKYKIGKGFNLLMIYDLMMNN